MRQCRNCGKRIPDKLTFCSNECAQEMENKFKNSFPISAEIREEEKEKTKNTISNESNLRSIYDFLDLNEAKDGRLIIKADIMKKVIFLTSMISMNEAFWSLGRVIGAVMGGLILGQYGYQTLGITLGTFGIIASLIISFFAKYPS